ncbi:uncharacterized protein LOC124915203 [Impatiens glandulifera]|uniref:uncharacterized protein LOC124915203 n=1 Tax=Impatiens glandulifera TaxID=253017 RepID=UPI001FB123B3|nr:uncharacterized protein LOC124915203 [Impatiens glandulifera]
MGSEGCSSPSALTQSSSSPSAKRSRDPEDELYMDNIHSHKRYLSEIMASSLNGLTVGDTLPADTLMESPARQDHFPFLRDESISVPYSPMSEDSEETRYCETNGNTGLPQTESVPSCPVSPYRCQRMSSVLSSMAPSASNSSHGCSLPTIVSSQPRQRGSDSETRFPSSPSDMCHSADLRKAALLRSVQMRTHESFGPEERPCSYMKSFVEERDYPVEECGSPLLCLSEQPEGDKEKQCRELNMDLKYDQEPSTDKRI